MTRAREEELGVPLHKGDVSEPKLRRFMALRYSCACSKMVREKGEMEDGVDHFDHFDHCGKVILYEYKKKD